MAVLDLDPLRVKIGLSSNSPQFLKACDEVARILLNSTWEDIYRHSAGVSQLLTDIVDSTPPDCANEVLIFLEGLASRYHREVDQDTLTYIHFYLAALCSTYHLTSSSLELFSQPSLELSLSADQIGQYFANCAEIHGIFARNWDDAAIHAALALTTLQTEHNYRRWCLYELIAHGSATLLPRAAWAVTTCNLVDELARLFTVKSRRNWYLIVQYTKEHQGEFEKFDLWPLVKRALATFCVHYVRDITRTLVAVPTFTLLGGFLKELSYDELVNAGLLDVCEIKDDIICSRFMTPNKAPIDLLTEMSFYARKS